MQDLSWLLHNQSIRLPNGGMFHMLQTPRIKEWDLLDELLTAAHDNKPRARRICDLLFSAPEIADDLPLVSTIVLARQMHIGKRHYALPPYEPLCCTIWRNGKSLTVEVPTDPQERRFDGFLRK